MYGLHPIHKKTINHSLQGRTHYIPDLSPVTSQQPPVQKDATPLAAVPTMASVREERRGEEEEEEQQEKAQQGE